jgi:hypothetical protein
MHVCASVCLLHVFTLDESTTALGTRKKLPNFVVCLTVFMTMCPGSYANDVSMTFYVTSVIDDTMTCSFRFAEGIFLGTCGREIERKALCRLLTCGDHGRALAAVTCPPVRISLVLGPITERRASTLAPNWRSKAPYAVTCSHHSRSSTWR